jgi:threonine-phosphate decarboxylase
MKGVMKTPFDHGGNVFAVARSLGVSPAELLDFSANINPLGPPAGVHEALSDVFASLVHYPDSECSLLRESLAIFHGVKPSNICASNGSTELIYLLPRLVRGKRALVIVPSFSEYASALQRDDCRVEFHILQSDKGFDLDLEEIKERIHNGFDLCILGNPGNPTGKLYTLAEVKSLFRLCRDARCLLVIDEAFMDFCEEESAKYMAAENEGILVLRSMTKFYALPGLRLGYAVASESMIKLISALREPWSVNTPAQAAGLASLAAKGYADTTREIIAFEREYLFTGFSAIPGFRPFPSAANFLLTEILEGAAAGDLAGRLLADRILIRECGNFVGLSDRFFRVAVRGRDENERLLAALAKAMGDVSGR